MTERAEKHPTRRVMLGMALGSATFALTGACVPTYRFHGYIPLEKDLALVEVGRTTEAELEALLGKPSVQGMLTGSDWFYISSTYRHFGALRPKEIDRQIIGINFDQSGIVRNVERFGLEHGRIVVLSRRVTDPGVSSLSALRQILGNIGNITAGQILD